MTCTHKINAWKWENMNDKCWCRGKWREAKAKTRKSNKHNGSSRSNKSKTKKWMCAQRQAQYMTVNSVSSLQPYQVVGSFEVVSVFFYRVVACSMCVFFFSFSSKISLFSLSLTCRSKTKHTKMYTWEPKRERENTCMCTACISYQHIAWISELNVLDVRIFICLFCLLPALCQFGGDQNEEKEKKREAEWSKLRQITTLVK